MPSGFVANFYDKILALIVFVGVIMFIKIMTIDKEKILSEDFKENILDYIKNEFEKDNILCVNMTVNDNDLYIEFGKGCCFISMTNEQKAELYNFVDNKENDDKYIDLYINCYKKYNLCYDINNIVEIIQTFSINGEPNLTYKWEIMSM
jgi:hypothetical protein